MIVSRNGGRVDSTAARRQRLRALAARRDLLGLLVELGEVEQGLVDGLNPERDGWTVAESRLRRAALAVARAYLAAARGDDTAPAAGAARAALEAIPWG